jgi:ribonuclease VapC
VVLDSSALLAILFGEPEAGRLKLAMANSGHFRMSAVNWLEAMMVLESRRGVDSTEDLQAFLDELDVQIIPFDHRHMEEAREAWRRFGKGRHPAGLNMADCAAYATAVLAGEPLLFKGDDFNRTGISAVVW